MSEDAKSVEILYIVYGVFFQKTYKQKLLTVGVRGTRGKDRPLLFLKPNKNRMKNKDNCIS